jgi:hypothetical protein
VGVPLPLCAAAVAAGRWWAGRADAPPTSSPIHGPALFIGNFLSAPAELALAIPYVRLGEALTGAPPTPLDPAHLSLKTAGGALARGLLAWALSVPLVAAGGAAALEPALAAAVGYAGGDEGEGGGGAPGTSPPPHPRPVRVGSHSSADAPDLEAGGEGSALGVSASGRAPLLPPAVARAGARPPSSPKGD